MQARRPPPLSRHGRLGILAISLISADIAIKIVLYLYCRRYASRSAIAAALAQDHRNDVVVNSVALTSSLIGAGLPGRPTRRAALRTPH